MSADSIILKKIDTKNNCPNKFLFSLFAVLEQAVYKTEQNKIKNPQLIHESDWWEAKILLVLNSTKINATTAEIVPSCV